VTKTIKDFEDSGLKLPAEERKKLIQIQKEISDLESKGEANINENKDKIEMSIAELKGVPEDSIKKFKKVEGKPDMVFV
jgi:Zn-dependent oligopeptidase